MEKDTKVVLSAVLILLFSMGSFYFLDATSLTGKAFWNDDGSRAIGIESIKIVNSETGDTLTEFSLKKRPIEQALKDAATKGIDLKGGEKLKIILNVNNAHNKYNLNPSDPKLKNNPFNIQLNPNKIQLGLRETTAGKIYPTNKDVEITQEIKAKETKGVEINFDVPEGKGVYYLSFTRLWFGKSDFNVKFNVNSDFISYQTRKNLGKGYISSDIATNKQIIKISMPYEDNPGGAFEFKRAESLFKGFTIRENEFTEFLKEFEPTDVNLLKRLDSNDLKIELNGRYISPKVRFAPVLKDYKETTLNDCVKGNYLDIVGGSFLESKTFCFKTEKGVYGKIGNPNYEKNDPNPSCEPTPTKKCKVLGSVEIGMWTKDATTTTTTQQPADTPTGYDGEIKFNIPNQPTYVRYFTTNVVDRVSKATIIGLPLVNGIDNVIFIRTNNNWKIKEIKTFTPFMVSPGYYQDKFIENYKTCISPTNCQIKIYSISGQSYKIIAELEPAQQPATTASTSTTPGERITGQVEIVKGPNLPTYTRSFNSKESDNKAAATVLNLPLSLGIDNTVWIKINNNWKVTQAKLFRVSRGKEDILLNLNLRCTLPYQCQLIVPKEEIYYLTQSRLEMNFEKLTTTTAQPTQPTSETATSTTTASTTGTAQYVTGAVFSLNKLGCPPGWEEKGRLKDEGTNVYNSYALCVKKGVLSASKLVDIRFTSTILSNTLGKCNDFIQGYTDYSPLPSYNDQFYRTGRLFSSDALSVNDPILRHRMICNKFSETGQAITDAYISDINILTCRGGYEVSTPYVFDCKSSNQPAPCAPASQVLCIKRS